MTPTTQTMPIPKERIRTRIAAQRRGLAQDQVREDSRRISDRVLAMAEVAAAHRIAAYLSRPHEVQIDGVIASLLDQGKRICVPAYHPGAEAYRFAWLDADTPTAPGAHGVAEPADPEWVNPGSMDVLIVPGVAFDRAGNRLGHGSGTYDRLLQHYRGFRIGVAFAFQLLDAVPTDHHDIGVHAVITPEESFSV